ncbi:alpha/beta hydrolase [Prochlorococcus marinus]|uniref:alpha/beta hydrolase n=1 Tax=Prochlorococcus marinus TaxID=1219 RepID=UPI0002E9B382|nr:alpha/beta hydrolase [Prochlorococcus marinus]
MSSRRSIRRIIALGLLTNLFSCHLRVGQLHAAERVEFHFEDVTIPISIKELSDWSKDVESKMDSGESDSDMNSELAVWLNMLGFESRFALSQSLQAPLVKDKSMARQLLRSWVGRKLLDEVSDVVRLDEDSSGTKVFNTLESLLEDQEKVSALDLLKSLPAEVIHFDLNAWVQVVSSWKDELKGQQKLLTDLRRLSLETNDAFKAKESDIEEGKSLNELKESIYEVVKLNVPHRTEALNVEVWNPLARDEPRKSWIVFMPGLGGDQLHFRWLARSLSHQGWPVVVLDHPGSDSKALNSLVDGSLPAPSGAEVFPYRLSDLRAVLLAREKELFTVPGEKVVLMGHSLGALTAFLASGNLPQTGLLERCKNALDDFSITNLSRLLQCQLVDVPLPTFSEITQLEAIVGINSFGSLLWPDPSTLKLNVPVFLTGGTFDLITPALSEQLGLLLSTKPNPFSRVLVIEGASHFSPIRVKNQTDHSKGEDLFQLGEALVGTYPLSVQGLLASQIIRYLDQLEDGKPLPTLENTTNMNLKFHILDHSTTRKVIGN